MSFELRPITAADEGLSAALRAEGLPVADLDAPDQRFFVGLDDGAPRVWGGWSGRGEDRLLRSVVVAPSARGRGLSRALVEALAAAAAEDGARRLWLLTTSAADVFARLGWSRVERAEVPPNLLAHPQFAGLCPASAACMVRDCRI
ncbi:MAG: arsenic resistance N-acetyltransferase ArsN2 [Siculibacillus sp.]